MPYDTDFPPLPSRNVRREDEKATMDHSATSVTEVRSVTSINDLPDELLLDILNQLATHESHESILQSLLNLSRVNRRFHYLVSDRLYTDYHWVDREPYLFLRTVICNPQIATHVRNIYLNYTKGTPSEFLVQRSYRPTASDKKLIKNGFKALEIPDWKSWVTDCHDDWMEDDVQHAAIIMHSPNIKHLSVTDSDQLEELPRWLDLIRWSVGGSRFGRMHRFTKLESINITVRCLHPRHLAPIFRLETLRTLKISGLINVTQHPEPLAQSLQRLVPSRSSPIERLTLVQSFINTEVLAVILGFIRALKHFRHDYFGDHFYDKYPDGGEQYWPVPGASEIGFWEPAAALNYPSICTALKDHSGTLESLRIGRGKDGEDISGEPIGIIGSLRAFQNLTDFEATLSSLAHIGKTRETCLVEMMPRSLKTLLIWIQEEEGDMQRVPALEDLACRAREAMPLLEKISIFMWSEDPSFEYDWDRLSKPLLEQGVEFDLKIYNGFWEE